MALSLKPALSREPSLMTLPLAAKMMGWDFAPTYRRYNPVIHLSS
jgi:hypothetical protein